MNPIYWYLIIALLSATVGAAGMAVFIVHRLGWRLDITKAEITRVDLDGKHHTSKLVLVGNDAYYLEEYY
jgi:hypothetical protein